MPGTDYKAAMHLINGRFLLFQNLHDDRLIRRPDQTTEGLDDRDRDPQASTLLS